MASGSGPLHGPQFCRLTLTQFRNHAHTSLSIQARHVAFTGPNGAGKTNILEALSLFSPGRGLRRARYGEMIAAGAPDGFAVVGEIIPMDHEPGDQPLRIGTGLSGPLASGREIRIDKVPVKSAEELAEHLTLLWLTPSMDGLFTGPANDRRRFFDRLVLALHPRHGSAASRFEQAMRARNRLFEDGITDPLWYEGLEEQMAQAAAQMQEARIDVLALLSEAIETARDAVRTFPHALLSLSGFERFVDEPSYRRMLAMGRTRDRAAGRALEGPHRTDLEVRHGPKDVEARSASTGEQKALLIGLILAQARLVRRETGRAAILLLDEIAAHLDERRRAALYDLCDELGGQTFMTGTDAALFDALPEGAQRFGVDEGQVQPAG